MKNQRSENKLVITEEFIFDQNKLLKDPNNHFKEYISIFQSITFHKFLLIDIVTRYLKHLLKVVSMIYECFSCI